MKKLQNLCWLCSFFCEKGNAFADLIFSNTIFTISIRQIRLNIFSFWSGAVPK